MTKRVVDVLVPVALDRAYSYRVPEELELAPGDIVCVPLGAREATAVVWADNPKPNPRLDNRLKDVEQKLELPPLRPELRSFVDWVANYTVSSRGMVLRMCLRMGEHLGAERERVGVRLARAPPQRMTPAPQRGLALFADGMVRGERGAAAGAGGAKARSGFFAIGIHAGPKRRRGGAQGDRGEGWLFRDLARRRHRLGQDGSVFRSGGGHYSLRPAELDADAGDRPDR